MATQETESLMPKLPKIPGFPWTITRLQNRSGSGQWFSDGKALYDTRGLEDGLASRLIVGNQGFLDFTSFVFPVTLGVDLNGNTISFKQRAGRDLLPWPPKLPGLGLGVDLEVDQGYFKAVVKLRTTSLNEQELASPDLSEYFDGFEFEGAEELSGTPIIAKGGFSITVQGNLKPLPVILNEDAAYMNTLIAQKYVPYQAIPTGGKPDEVIGALGKQFFPFTPHNYELAISLYDWTTASFTRMVLMKVFQYTGMEKSPLCKGDIASMIWESNWNGYKPSNKDYMKSFLMEPASSLDNVKSQLDKVADELRRFSDTENRLLAAAMTSMPRTSYIQKPQLFSGQVDIYQFTKARFGVEFLECPINRGPVSDQMTWDLENALDTFISSGKIITTKMVWSFTDSYEDAFHYSNGIVLVISNPPLSHSNALGIRSFVWDKASFITPLSDEDDKIEYTFSPGTQFKVGDWYKNGTGTAVINLQVFSPDQPSTDVASAETLSNNSLGFSWPWKLSQKASEAYERHYDDSKERKTEQRARELKDSVEPDALLHASIAHNNRGRWCRCVQAVDNVLN